MTPLPGDLCEWDHAAWDAHEEAGGPLIRCRAAEGCSRPAAAVTTGSTIDLCAVHALAECVGSSSNGSAEMDAGAGLADAVYRTGLKACARVLHIDKGRACSRCLHAPRLCSTCLEAARQTVERLIRESEEAC